MKKVGMLGCKVNSREVVDDSPEVVVWVGPYS